MRIWSIHPKYLDTKGLVALWRETLLGNVRRHAARPCRESQNRRGWRMDGTGQFRPRRTGERARRDPLWHTRRAVAAAHLGEGRCRAMTFMNFPSRASIRRRRGRRGGW